MKIWDLDLTHGIPIVGNLAAQPANSGIADRGEKAAYTHMKTGKWDERRVRGMER